jgi:hypothetical protein
MKTNNASNAKLQYEAGQEISSMAAMTDTGDHKTFEITGVAPWSGKSGYEPKIYPDGLETGGVVTPGTGNDNVSVAALTCYLAGVKTTVSADASVAVTRPTGAKNINSITISAVGEIVVIPGTDGSAFTATRDAAGGPPLIPVGSIEIAQVKLSSATPAPVEASEIFQVPGTSLERYDYPVWTEDNYNGKITFASALPAIHESSPSAYKGVYAEVYEPVFADLEPTSDFVPAETAHSVSSKQVYGGVIGSSSETLNQGSFIAYLKDGITDPIIGLKNQVLFFKYFSDRNRMPYILIQGKLGVGRTFPAGDNLQATCTISAAIPGVDKAS